jgi:hypothetical protein
MLADGIHDVFVVDVSPDPDDPTPGTWLLDLTVLAGDHKGEVVTVRATGLAGGEFDLLGMPGTLTVVDGQPRVRIDA